MRRSLPSLLVCALLAQGTAFADPVGPAAEPRFEEVARRSLELGDEPILLFGRANWLFGADEFHFDQTGEILPTEGLLILLDSDLVFGVWDPVQDGYVQRLRIPYAEMAEVRQRVWGVSQRFVVVTERGTLHAFTFTSSGGTTVNTPRTVKGLNIVRRKLGIPVPE